MDDSELYQTYSEFEFVSRKSRGRKKKTNWVAFKEDKNEPTTSFQSPASNNISPGVTPNEPQLPTSNNGIVEVIEFPHVMQVDASVFNKPQYETQTEVLEEEVSQTPTITLEDKVQVTEESIKSQQIAKEFPFINTRALPYNASTYELEKFEKKALIIFNQETFDTHDPRPGTARDVEALTASFERFGFDVFSHDNLTKDDIFKELEEFSSQNFTDYGCVAVAVLTHGSEYGTLRARDRQFNEIDIINHFKDFNKPTLVTKPKLIIIQACRGPKISESVPVHMPYSAKIEKDHEEDSKPYLLPVESDMLILHSSYAGKCSIRDTLNGTWFIQELCKKINALSPDQDMESIMVEVKREVAINREYTDRITRDVNKQMPVMTSTLIRKLYLKSFGAQTSDVTYADNRTIEESMNSVAVSERTRSEMTEMLRSPQSCICFLDHFEYLRSCLMHFNLDHPGDEIAKNYLAVTNTLGAGSEFFAAKREMGKVISKYFQDIMRSSNGYCYKYLYFYNH